RQGAGLADQVQHLRCGDRLAEIIALDEVAAERPQKVELRLRLDALRDDREIHRLAQRDERLDEGVGGRIESDLAHEAAVDLELVERELAQIADRREAGPEIVQRELEAELLEARELAFGERRVLDEDALGELQLE